MPIVKSKIVKNLTKKGFTKIEGGKHLKLVFTHNGKVAGPHTIISRTPHLKEYPDNLLSKMASHLKLNSKRELENLINCPMSEQEYIEKIGIK